LYEYFHVISLDYYIFVMQGC